MNISDVKDGIKYIQRAMDAAVRVAVSKNDRINSPGSLPLSNDIEIRMLNYQDGANGRLKTSLEGCFLIDGKALRITYFPEESK